MTDFKNKFSWSKSRDTTFKECKRKYFYNYYGYWKGWETYAPEETRLIYYLKKLNPKEVWVGQLIHETIRYTLEQAKLENPISLNHAVAILRKKLHTGFEESLIKSFTGFSSKLNKLFEHEYKIEFTQEQKTELFKKAENCIVNFYNSDTFREIQKIPKKDWIFLEDFLSFEFENTTIYLSIDFAVKKDDKLILYDWKTGKERTTDFDMQLATYALFVMKKLDLPVEKVTAKIYNLSIDKEDEFLIDKEKIENIKGYIRESIKDMKEMLKNQEENIAKEKEEFEKNESFFCKRCNFRKLCLGY